MQQDLSGNPVEIKTKVVRKYTIPMRMATVTIPSMWLKTGNCKSKCVEDCLTVGFAAMKSLSPEQIEQLKNPESEYVKRIKEIDP